MNRFVYLLLALVFALPASALTVATKGTAELAIVLPDAPAAEEQEAASELAAYLRKLTGATFEVVGEQDVAGRKAIFVGATQAAAAEGVSAAKLDSDGFVIKTTDGNAYLVGHDATATEFAAHYFLQRYGGIRWYLPLEIGEHVPQKSTFTLPDKLNDVQQPDWQSRLWSSVAVMDPMWSKRNLCRARYSFHHNLLNVLKPSKVYDQHPDWFPLIDGQRLPKPPDEAHSWQPCFASKDMAQWVAENALKFFYDNPTASSYSLGINDVGEDGYCQCPACQALDDQSKLTFRGRPNYSNRVFTFMNRVAEITSQRYPDKLLGCLAYANCEEVPSFPIHQNIIPYLTNDRAQWRDKAFKAQDQDLLRRWAKAARQLGVYDYYYGSGYVIPRFFPGISAESIKFCHKTGARAWYAEIYSNWGLDGCKAWLASQLLWDTKADANRLEEQYYTDFFGPAKGPMKRYWQRCEEIWVKQPGEALWFKGFFALDQLEMFPPQVCKELRGYLTQAEKLANTDLLRKRVKLYSDGFHYTELYAGMYWGDKALREAAIKTPQDAARVMQALSDYALASSELERFYADVILKDPLLKPVLPFNSQARGTIGYGVLPAMAALADYHATAGAPELPLTLTGEAADTPGGRVYRAYLLLRKNGNAAVELLPNPGFESGATAAQPQGAEWKSEDAPPGWGTWIRGGSPAELRWVKDPVRSGNNAVMLKGAIGAASYLTTVPIETGQVYLATIYARGTVKDPSKLQLKVQWQDKEKAWFGDAPPHVCPLPASELRVWTPLQVMFSAPPGAAYAVMLALGDDMEPGDYVFFDDASVKRVPLE